MKMTLAIIAALVVVAVAIVFILALRMPDTLVVTRRIVINAPAAQIFPFINDFHKWAKWSAYETKDPGMKRTFSGAPEGKGTVYEWDGDGNVGKGRMEILDSNPSKITIKLDFIKPFEGHNTAVFALEPEGNGTAVTWTMTGASPWLGRVIGVFIDMDRMIGSDFEAGLANLKTVTET